MWRALAIVVVVTIVPIVSGVSTIPRVMMVAVVSRIARPTRIARSLTIQGSVRGTHCSLVAVKSHRDVSREDIYLRGGFARLALAKPTGCVWFSQVGQPAW